MYLMENLKKSFIILPTAPFAYPILMAKKPGGGLRFCVDYRKLNSVTKKDCYPLLLVEELLGRISRGKIYTKLDICQGLYWIRMTPEAEDLTTFRTRYGMYRYWVMPFGLANGLAIFQGFINDIFMELLDDFGTVFIDDLLIFSDAELQHQEHVKKVLQRLREAGLQASIKKCEFHVKVDPEKVSIVKNWDILSTVRGIRSFLGFWNFYRKFIKNYSWIARPPNLLIRKDTVFYWDSRCREAFDQLK